MEERKEEQKEERNDLEYDHERDDRAGQDFGWRGTDLDKGFGYRYDKDTDVEHPSKQEKER